MSRDRSIRSLTRWSRSARAGTVALTAAWLSPSVLAQVFVPPEQAPAEKTYPEVADWMAVPETTRPQPRLPVRRPEPLPAYRPMGLAESGERERIVRPLEIAALKHNPLVTPEDEAKVRQVLVERRRDYELRIIENPDLVLDMEPAALRARSFTSLEEIEEFGTAMQALQLPQNVVDQLRTEGAISPRAAQLNRQIVDEYRRAVGEEMALPEGEDDIVQAVATILKEQAPLELRELYEAFYSLLAESASKIDAVIERAGLPASLRSLKAEYPETVDAQRELATRVLAEFRALGFDQQQALLRTTTELREDPDQPPYPAVDLETPPSPEGAEQPAGETRVRRLDPDEARAFRDRAREVGGGSERGEVRTPDKPRPGGPGGIADRDRRGAGGARDAGESDGEPDDAGEPDGDE